jgi:hypothetical protein
MKRKMFATAVVLIVMATPLFGAQAPAAKPAPAQGTAPAKAAEKANDQKAPAKAAAPAPAKTATSVAPAKASAGSKVPPAPPQGVSAATKAAAAPTTPAAAPTKPAAAPVKAAAPAKPAATASAAVVKPASGPLSPVQEKVRGSKELTTDVQGKLPGVDAVDAAGGFSDLHQFLSAVYASHNLGVKFDALKGKLLNGKRTSLRQAIHELRPASSAVGAS